jgi:hypothetical protein
MASSPWMGRILLLICAMPHATSAARGLVPRRTSKAFEDDCQLYRLCLHQTYLTAVAVHGLCPFRVADQRSIRACSKHACIAYTPKPTNPAQRLPRFLVGVPTLRSTGSIRLPAALSRRGANVDAVLHWRYIAAQCLRRTLAGTAPLKDLKQYQLQY